jgi:epoxyqueuosine reductase
MSFTIKAHDLQEISHRHCFSMVGITSLTPPVEFAAFNQWIQSGFHGRMAYLENLPGLQLRANPQGILPHACSLVMLGARYPIDRMAPLTQGLSGRVSSYAWGKDYHDVLRQKAELVAADLYQLSGQSPEFRVTVDSDPVLEKPLAQRSGLGWIGKNSCLIHPQHGSFFFLAGIFSTLEFEPVDQVKIGSCGSCRRCVDACPTGCILPDRTIDARKCISYLTIENKGSIPQEYRESIGDWVFGCDVCQSVCPWNHKPDNAAVLPEFLPSTDTGLSLDLPEIIHLSATEFKTQFSNSPILRAKRDGLLRNAAVVLGNTRSTDALEPLTRLVSNEFSPLVRSHAAWGLGRISGSKSRDILSSFLHSEVDVNVQREILNALNEN